jgi:hypothetical protein
MLHDFFSVASLLSADVRGQIQGYPTPTLEGVEANGFGVIIATLAVTKLEPTYPVKNYGI